MRNLNAASVCVIEDGHVKGVLTRTDLFRIEALLLREEGEEVVMARSRSTR